MDKKEVSINYNRSSPRKENHSQHTSMLCIQNANSTIVYILGKNLKSHFFLYLEWLLTELLKKVKSCKLGITHTLLENSKPHHFIYGGECCQ